MEGCLIKGPHEVQFRSPEEKTKEEIEAEASVGICYASACVPSHVFQEAAAAAMDTGQIKHLTLKQG